MKRDPRELYQEAVLEHSKNPRNEGTLDEATHSARETNALCGDRVTVHLRVRDGQIEAATFEARGCAVARASASLLTEVVRSASTDAARARAVALARAVQGGAEPLGALEPLRSVARFPSRRRCATLPWEALLAALDEG